MDGEPPPESDESIGADADEPPGMSSGILTKRPLTRGRPSASALRTV